MLPARFLDHLNEHKVSDIVWKMGQNGRKHSELWPFKDFSLPLLPKARTKISVGNKESGLKTIANCHVVDMLGSKIKLRWQATAKSAGVKQVNSARHSFPFKQVAVKLINR